MIINKQIEHLLLVYIEKHKSEYFEMAKESLSIISSTDSSIINVHVGIDFKDRDIPIILKIDYLDLLAFIFELKTNKNETD